MGARGTISLASLAFLFLVMVSPLGISSASAQENREPVLPGCGIAFPAGYDINTVGQVQGKFSELQVPAEGPVRFIVVGEGERWVVLASPAWFWKMSELRFVPGDIVTVQGSKALGADGTLYLIAQEIRPPGTGAAVVLRDRRGAPLWRSDGSGGRMPGGGHGGGMGEGIGRGHNAGGGRR